MSIDSIVHLYKRVLIVSSLLLWPYPMFAQLHSIEIKVIDAENGNSIEFATVQWKGLNEPSYKNGTTTNRKGVAKLNIPRPLQYQDGRMLPNTHHHCRGSTFKFSRV